MSATVPQSDAILLDIHRVKQLTGLSRTVIYRLMSRGEFPKPKAIPTGARRWTRASIMRWAERLKEVEDYACE